MWTGAGGWRWEDWELVLEEHLLSWIGPTACAWRALLRHEPASCSPITHGMCCLVALISHHSLCPSSFVNFSLVKFLSRFQAKL